LLPPDAVSVVLPPPQITVLPEIFAAIAELIVTVMLAVSAQLPDETITE
jgi:hypothetical protein